MVYERSVIDLIYPGVALLTYDCKDGDIEVSQTAVRLRSEVRFVSG